MQVMCSSIAVVAFAFYVLYIYEAGLRENFNFWLARRKSRYEKCFLMLVVILALDLPFCGLWNLVVWLWYLVYEDYQFYLQFKRNERRTEPETIMLIVGHFLWLQMQLILLKYEEWTQVDWFWLLLMFLMLSIVMGGLIVLIGWPFIFQNQRFTFGMMDDDAFDDESEEAKVKAGRVNVVICFGYYLAFLALFLSAYVSELIYQITIWIALAFNLIESLLYWFCEQKMVAYYNSDFFLKQIAVRVGQNQFRQITNEGELKKVEWDCELGECLFCSQPAEVLHNVCGRIIYCWDCHQKRYKDKNKKICDACPVCKNKHGQKMLVLPKTSELWLQNAALFERYFQPAEYLMSFLY